MAHLFDSEFQLGELATMAVAAGAARGIELVSKTEKGPGSLTRFELAPYTCVPTATPRNCFEVKLFFQI
jgi:hypothetical protein